MKTPQYITRTLLAGGFASITAPGRYLTIASISASTISVGLDGDTPERVIAGGRTYNARGFRLLRVQNTGAVPSTFVFVVSEDEYSLSDSANAVILAAISSSLLGMEQEIIGGPATAQLADLLLPITPGPGLQIFAANALRKEIEITAPETNAGYVYLGITAARSTAVDKFVVLYPGGIWWSEREKGAIFGCGSDALENVNGREC
jgi:hypothetical protein